MNCTNVGLLDDLKKHILIDLMSVPSSGIAKAARTAHIHATRSSSGKFTTNCLSLPEISIKNCFSLTYLIQAKREPQ